MQRATFLGVRRNGTARAFVFLAPPCFEGCDVCSGTLRVHAHTITTNIQTVQAEKYVTCFNWNW